MENYILPDIKISDDFKKINESPLYSENVRYIHKIETILSKNRNYVLSEPGYGKTRLLAEIFKVALKKNMNCVMMNLKKLAKDIEIDAFIKDYDNKFEIFDNNKDVEDYQLIKTKNFKMENSNDVLICLDALDEVEGYRLNDIIEYIEAFSNKYSEITLIVACRTVFIEKKLEIFIKNKFNFLLLESFSEDNIREFFKKHNIEEEVIEKLIRKSLSCLKVPRYLGMINKLLEKGEDVSKIKKAELFEEVIYYKLKTEYMKKDKKSEDIAIAKRVLEKLALVMQIYQTKQITKDELMTFFDDVKSDLKNYFLQYIKLQEFFDRSLLKNNGETIEFENAEFQEYLASKEIMRLGNVEQVVYDLSVNENLKQIYPSWYNTIKFLVDMQPTLLKKIISYENIKNGDNKSHDYFRFIVNIEVNNVSIKDKREIFKTTFLYYNEMCMWIENDIVNALPNFFDNYLEEMLKEVVEQNNNEVKIGNTIRIIGALLEKKISDKDIGLDLDYWKVKLIKYVKFNNDSIKVTLIRILGMFKDIKLLEGIADDIEKSKPFVFRSFINVCTKINSNSIFSIEYIIKDIKLSYGFDKKNIARITEKKAIKYLLSEIIKDKEILIKFSENERIESKYDNIFIKNIQKVWDNEIEKLIQNLIIIALSIVSELANMPNLIIELIKLVTRNRKNYIYEILDNIVKNKFKKYDLYYICSQIIKINEVDIFIEEASKRNLKLFALETLQRSRFFENNDLYEAGRKYFKKEYEKLEYERNNIGKKLKTEKYEQFKLMLEPEKGSYSPDIFEFINNNNEELLPLIRNEEQEFCRLKILIKAVLKHINPINEQVEITERNNGHTSYKMSYNIKYFEDCIRLLKLLNLGTEDLIIKNYRQKIVSFIPWATETIEDIFFIISNPKSEEIKLLLSIYNSQRDDDLKQLNPKNFIEAVRRYSIYEAVPIIKEFAKNEKLSMTDRINSLNVLAEDKNNEKFFSELFSEYIHDIENINIAEELNTILIRKYQNENAIIWRINEIEKRANDKYSLENFGWSGEAENELLTKYFAQPLMEISDIKYKLKFYNLLKNSLKKLNDDEYTDIQYRDYITQIVFRYFENLRITKNSRNLIDLEIWIQKNSSKIKNINGYKYRIQELRKLYLNEADKPISIQQCIKIYNRLKHNIYLDIASPEDLLNIIREVINKDLYKWIKFEGAYKFIEESTGNQETMIQKTIKTQFENALFKRGFRGTGIIREPQLLNDIRPDFLISYGFVGSIVIEVKRIANKEVINKGEREKYLLKLKKYLEGTNSNYLIYLLFNTKKEDDLEKYLPEIKECYQDEHQITVEGLSCVLPSENSITDENKNKIIEYLKSNKKINKDKAKELLKINNSRNIINILDHLTTEKILIKKTDYVLKK